MIKTPAIAPRRRLYYGWVIVGVVLVLNMMYGSATPLFGLFVLDMQNDLGWSRTTVILTLTIVAIVSGPSYAITGPLADRYGARFLIFFTGIFGGIFIALGGLLANSPWQFYLLFGVLGLAVMQSSGIPITHVVISKWFIAKRGRALGWSAAGMSLGPTILIPIITLAINQFGWRWGFAILGALFAIGTSLPSLMALKRAPEDMGLLPDGVSPEEAKAQASAVAQGQPVRKVTTEQSWTLRDAMATRTFWLLLLAGATGTMAMSATFIHVIPYLRGEKGFGDLASVAWSTWFVFSVTSKIVWGYISEKIHVQISVVIVYVGEALGTILLLHVGGSVPMLFLWAVVHGSLHGPSAQLQTLIWANYYGRGFLGTIRGVFMFPTAFSQAGGPLLAAYIFDRVGFYRPIWLLFMSLFFLSAFLFTLSKQPKARSLQNKAEQTAAQT